ncbi:hypothetical protein M5G22_10085 [Pseudomonas sp. TNT2022 ID233]|uniref:hypothetical protein n=1 Tax=Pseudomonas aphyarum TaxID=2942629 RepID=UPI00235E3C12|nr:hypothetical protein [Pseudomonas aphyarum]MDD1137899.1 hypothetical protein [Pseudomonas aphyarum]
MDSSTDDNNKETFFETSEFEINDIEFFLENLQYTRTGEYAENSIHMMCPIQQGNHEYSVPIDSSKKYKKILNCFFSSLDENENFDIGNFQNLIEANQFSEESIPSFGFEYKAMDCMVHNALVTNRKLSFLFSGKEQTHLGLNIATIVLNRTISTLQSTSLLLKSGYSGDAKCLLRVALEQIAYAYQVLGINDEKVIKNLKKTLSIKNLKELIPEAGVLYGYLTDFIHNNNNIWSEFLELEEDTNHNVSKMYIKVRSGESSRETTMIVVRVVEAYLAVAYHISKNFEHNNKYNIKELIFTQCELAKMIRARYYKKNHESEPRETV